MSELPSHASPMIAPQPRPSSQYLSQWSDLHDSGPPTPSLPSNLLSPAFTPPSTPGIATPSGSRHHEPKSTPVDTLSDTTRQPRLLERLPVVECVVRARIPTTSGAEMFLYLYQNDADSKEHLAIVFGNVIRSNSLDAERPGETEMDRMIRGAYVGRLRPGRVSSRLDTGASGPNGVARRRTNTTSSLRNVQTVTENGIAETEPTNNLNTSQPSTPPQETITDPSSRQPNTDPQSPRQNEYPNATLKAPLVRIHSECYTGETAWSARCDCGEQLDEAARLMSHPSSLPMGGVIVYLRQEGRGIGLASKLKAYNLQDLGNDTIEANLFLRHPADARSYGLATSILCDLGLGSNSNANADGNTGYGDMGIRLLTNNPEKVRAVEGPNREVRVRERVAMVPLAWRTGGKTGVKGAEIERYLETKIGRMGHRIYEEDKERERDNDSTGDEHGRKN